MPFFNCDPCKRSFPVYTNLVMHYQTGDHKQKGDVCPAKADCQTDAVPPGYELRLPREAAPKGPARPLPEPPDPNHLEEEGHGEDRPEEERTSRRTETPQSERVRPPREEDKHGDELRKEGGRREATGDDRRARRLPYREMPEPANILKTILEDYPGMTDDIIDEIMSWVEVQGGVMDPMQVQYLLTQMANIPKGAATLVPAKYTLALQNAADRGQSEVLAAMDSWGGINPMNGGMPRGFGRRVNPMNPMMNFGNPFGGGMNPMNRMNPMFGLGGGMRRSDGYDDYEAEPEYRPRRRAPRDEGDGEPARGDPRYDRLDGAVMRLETKLDELTTQKKDDALNARLDEIEGAVLRLDKHGDNGDPVMAHLTTQVDDLKREIGETKGSRLEEKLEKLEQEISDAKDERFVALQEQITELKDKVQHPTGRGDMDVVGDIASKGLDTLKKAGEDVRAIVMAGHTKEEFAADRIPVEKRIKAGQELAANVEKEARVLTAEDTLLAMEK